LRANRSILSFEISKFAAKVRFLDANKNANKTDGCRELLRVFSMLGEKFMEIRNRASYCYY
jgi:hypothetical protein